MLINGTVKAQSMGIQPHLKVLLLFHNSALCWIGLNVLMYECKHQIIAAAGKVNKYYYKLVVTVWPLIPNHPAAIPSWLPAAVTSALDLATFNHHTNTGLHPHIYVRVVGSPCASPPLVSTAMARPAHVIFSFSKSIKDIFNLFSSQLQKRREFEQIKPVGWESKISS